MRSATPSVENKNLDRLLCSWAMRVLSPHALFVHEGDKEKWENTKNEIGTKNPLALVDKRGACRQWNLSPNSFVKYVKHVFTMFNVAGETKHWAFSKMWYPKLSKLSARAGSNYDKWVMCEKCSKSTVEHPHVLTTGGGGRLRGS